MMFYLKILMSYLIIGVFISQEVLNQVILIFCIKILTSFLILFLSQILTTLVFYITGSQFFFSNNFYYLISKIWLLTILTIKSKS